MTTHSNLERVLAQLLIGDSPAMRRLRADIMSIADTRLPVLIQGPTGAGKELVAEGLHLASVRGGPMVAFNVCAVSDTMFEDALFGHVRGAFTGAQSDAPGYLLEADRGTLFLDEIGGLSMTAQAKLLRAIETRRFRPVGARADRSSDFRLVSATNEPLSALVSVNRFRLDLAHRLGAVVLKVPALGDRLDDVPLLAKHFAREMNSEDSHPLALAADAMDRLQRYRWPGNVRELRHVVEHAVARARGREWVTAAEIAAALPSAATVEPGPSTAAEMSLSRYRLVRELERFDWRIAETAQSLGVHRVTVFRRMRHLGIVPPAGARSRDTAGPGGGVGVDVAGGCATVQPDRATSRNRGGDARR